MNSNKLLHVALLGDFEASEFAAAREQVEQDAVSIDFCNPARLLAGIENAAAAELVVVAQSRPRQWNGPWLQELRRASPLVRVVAIVGTWCEGETRTGEPLAADIRLFWYDFPAWWTKQMTLIAAGRAADWCNHGSNGWHASSRENSTGTGEHEHGGLVVIAAEDPESAESIASVCQLGGWAGVWARWPAPVPVIRGATAIIYDGGQLDERELAAIGQLRKVYGPLPVVALSDFPRIDRLQAAKENGVRAVLGKPYRVDDLADSLRRTFHIQNGLGSHDLSLPAGLVNGPSTDK